MDISVFSVFAVFVSEKWPTKANCPEFIKPQNNMDPIADFLTAIRNGYLAKRETVTTSFSNQRQALADIFVKRGFLKNVEKVSDGFPKLKLTLHYLPDGQPVLTHVKRISKPGVRRYAGVSEIPTALSGAGLTIVSTSAGLLTDKEAKAKRLGGEVICQIW